MMNRFNLTDMAASIYDGGWRADDRKELIAEYGLTADEADEICEILTEYATRETD